MGNKAGNGVVKYAGYKNGGIVSFKGTKNKRKKKIRLQKEAEEFEAFRRQREREEREAEFYGEWSCDQEDSRW
jgi:uncharacterized membrane protein YebE (DUF533 family)